MAQCVESILGQSCGDFELLLVDDGSRDNSLAICHDYAAKDARIRVIAKDNGGVSSARNVGLAAATGEWVMFVDSDDRLTSNALESCGPYLGANDIVRFEIVDVYADGSHRRRKLRWACTKKHLLRQIVGHATMVSSCASLYRRSLFVDHNVVFNEEVRYGEDWIVLAQLVFHARRVKLLPRRGYYLYTRSNEHSCTNTISVAGHIEALEAVEFIRREVGGKYESDLRRARCRLAYDFLKSCGYELCARTWVENSHRVPLLSPADVWGASTLRLRRRIRLSKLVCRYIKQLTK